MTIGIPSFVLALAPSSGPWRPDRYLQSVARFGIPAGLAIGLGIIAGYLLARFDLSLARSRTVATGVVVVCGLAVVIRLEREHGWRRFAIVALCALMALLYALALIVPFLRSFYELTTPTGEEAAAWAIGTVLGVGGCSPRCACCTCEYASPPALPRRVRFRVWVWERISVGAAATSSMRPDRHRRDRVHPRAVLDDDGAANPAGGTRIALALDAKLRVPWYVPARGIGEAIAEGFVTAACRALAARRGRPPVGLPACSAPRPSSARSARTASRADRGPPKATDNHRRAGDRRSDRARRGNLSGGELAAAKRRHPLDGPPPDYAILVATVGSE